MTTFDYNTGKPLAEGQAQSVYNSNTGVKIGTSPTEMASAAKSAGYTAPNVNTPFGSSAMPGIGKSQADAMGNAYGAITNNSTIPVPAYGSKNADGSVNKFDPNTGKALVDPNAPAATIKSTDPNTGVMTMSDGTIQQPDANTAALYSEKTSSINQTNADYSAQESQMESTANANISVLEQQKADALAALTEESGVGSPDSGENTTLTSSKANLAAKYDQAINEAKANLANGKANLLNSKNDALAKIQTQFQTNQQSIISNTQATGKADWSEWSKSLAGDGTDDPSIGAQALLQQNLGNSNFTPAMAIAQANSAIAKQTIATDKSLSAEDRTNRTAASNAFYKGIAQITEPFNSLMQTEGGQATISALAQQLIDSGQAKDVQTAMSMIKTMNKSAVTAANTASRTAIAAENANRLAANANKQDKQGWDKATILDQVGIEKYITSGTATLTVNGEQVPISQEDLQTIKNDPDLFNRVMSQAITDGFIVETSVPVQPE